MDHSVKEIVPPYYMDSNCCTVMFLGGGITNCEDWQKVVIDYLKENSKIDLQIFNPRRPDFDVSDPSAAEKQIEWEYKNIHNSDIFTMYFADSQKSVQPICFYELGKYKQIWMKNNKQLYIGCHPDFSRRYDVIKQCQLDGIEVFEGTPAAYAIYLNEKIKPV